MIKNVFSSGGKLIRAFGEFLMSNFNTEVENEETTLNSFSCTRVDHVKTIEQE